MNTTTEHNTRAETSECDGVGDKQLCIVLLDGTWSEARSMFRYMTRTWKDEMRHVTQVCLPVGIPTAFTRTQVVEDRVSTLEALAYVLEVRIGAKRRRGQCLCVG